MTDRPHRLTAGDLIAALAGPPADRTPTTEIHAAVVDSRLATPGCLFVALRGEQHDGHDFIAQAIANGSAVALVERVTEPAGCQVIDLREPAGPAVAPVRDRPLCLVVPDSLLALQRAAAFWREKHAVSVVGITGSVGKTTSKEMIAAVLRQRFVTLKSEGNYNNEIGLPLTLLHLTGDHEQVVLEMGMYDLGEIALLARIARPQIGLVTNVGPSHLERLGSIERIAQAKAELPQALPPADQGGVAVLNIDDDRVMAMADQTAARVFTYGLSPHADLWASDVESHGLEGIRFQLHYQGEAVYARVPLLGRHSVHTALAAAAVGVITGLSWEEIMGGLRDQQAQLRLIAAPGPAGATLLDDTYNASPASSVAALNLMHEMNGRKVAVLGDMYELGSYAEEGHRLVGRRAREVADLLVTVGPLGRTIGEEALAAGMRAGSVHQVENNSQAVALLQSLIQPGDVVLIKGSRGARMDRIVAALTQPRTSSQAPAGRDREPS